MEVFQKDGIILIVDTLQTPVEPILYSCFLQPQQSKGETVVVTSKHSVNQPSHWQAVQKKYGIVCPNRVEVWEPEEKQLVKLVADRVIVKDLDEDYLFWMNAIAHLSRSCRQVIVCLSGDAQPDSLFHDWMTHQATVRISIHPLEAGWTEDVDGQLIVTDGLEESKKWLFAVGEKAVSFF